MINTLDNIITDVIQSRVPAVAGAGQITMAHALQTMPRGYQKIVKSLSQMDLKVPDQLGPAGGRP